MQPIFLLTAIFLATWKGRFCIAKVSGRIRKAEQIIGQQIFQSISLNLAFPPFGDHPPGSLFHQIQCVSYLKVICAHSWEYIEAIGDHFSPKLRSITPLFLIQVEKNHPVCTFILNQNVCFHSIVLRRSPRM